MATADMEGEIAARSFGIYQIQTMSADRLLGLRAGVGGGGGWGGGVGRGAIRVLHI